jgi:uncharacterized protein YdgA (DUF945 family)
MKKLIIGILLLIAIAGVGAPFVNGLMMEKTVKQTFKNLNTMYSDIGSGVSIEIVKYDRSFFSTEIEWKMILGSLSAIYGVNDIIFLDRAEHGYTGIVSKTSLEKNKWFTDLVNSKLAGKNPLAITTEYKLSGLMSSTIVLDPFSMQLEGEVVEIKAGKAIATCDKELKNFSSEASWEGFSVPKKLKVDGITMSSSLERLSTYLWDGTLSFGMGKGVIVGPSSHQIELVNFKVDYSLDVDDEEKTISIVSSFGADNLLAGPETMENGFVRMGLVNMDVQAFEEFMKLYTEIANTVLQDITAAQDDPEKMKTILEEEMTRTQFQIMAAYEKLLKKGLEFQITDLYAKLPAGELKGDVVLTLNKDMTFAQFFPLVQQPELVVDIFSLRSDISLPAKLVNDNPMLLMPLQQGMPTGLFIKNGDNFSHKAETKDGKLYLNGQEVVF